MNAWASVNRIRKARRILAVLDEAAPGGQILGASVARLTDAEWTRAAFIAGCKPPSLETRAIVAEIVATRDREDDEAFSTSTFGPTEAEVVAHERRHARHR